MRLFVGTQEFRLTFLWEWPKTCYLTKEKTASRTTTPVMFDAAVKALPSLALYAVVPLAAITHRVRFFVRRHRGQGHTVKQPSGPVMEMASKGHKTALPSASSKLTHMAAAK